MTHRKITIKPVGSTNFNEHDVFSDGEHVARFKFVRNNDVSRDGNGSRRTIIRTDSWVEDVKTGERFLDQGYSWFKDITRDVRWVFGRNLSWSDFVNGVS